MATSAQQATKSTQSAIKRLLHELRAYSSEPNPALLKLGPVSDGELLKWEAVMKGADGTAYEGGLYHLLLSIPATYPLSPPVITFTTPIVHPNVHLRTGEICLDLLKGSWTPAYTISATMTAVQQLLTAPEPDSPLNVDVAMLYRAGDVVAVEGIVRFFTQEERWMGEV